MRPEPNRPSRRSAKGQAMVIFALTSVLLFVIAGLAVDAGTSYLTSNKVERAAAAAALAGVAYLPGDYADAQNAALVEAARDGFPNAGSANACAGNPSPCVVTAQPADNKLTVTISVSVSTIFLRIVGFGSHTVVRSETAIYLPPISLGQSGSQQGSDLASLGSGGSNFYFERTEGWGNPRSEGDAFTPSPSETSNGCGPSGSDGCSAASAPDYHAISAEAGTVAPDATLNYQGGSNYLITIPPGQSADVQIYNPSFAPDNCTPNGSGYCYHENDGSFEGNGAPCTDYSAMEYTIYQVSTLSSRSGDSKLGQEVFYPYNASGLPSNYFYFNPASAACPSKTTVSGYTPTSYHSWISALNFTPTNGNDQNLYKGTTKLGSYLSNPVGATVNKYFRLEVDTLQWNGSPTCKATAGPCAYPSTATDTQSEAHKGYAVRLVSDNGAPGTTLGTVNGSACANSSCGTASAMDDMVVYTPVNGATTRQFSIPLFNVDASYAGQVIDIDLYDIGDVGNGPAYVGLQEPDGTTWAPAVSMTDLGASLAGANPPGGGSNVSALGTWPGTGGGSCSACFQTAGSSGGAIYQGQWVQIQMQVPQTFTAGYWNLVYDVSSGATAGDTFSVEVGFNGTPDHLLP